MSKIHQPAGPFGATIQENPKPAVENHPVHKITPPLALPPAADPQSEPAIDSSMHEITSPLAEARLVIEFSKGDLPIISKLEIAVGGCCSTHSSRSNGNAGRLRDVTKSAITQLLMEQEQLEYKQTSIIGGQEDGEYVNLPSDLQRVEFPTTRLQQGTHQVVFAGQPTTLR